MSTSAGDTIPGNTSSTFNIGLTGYPNGAGTRIGVVPRTRTSSASS